MSYTTNYLQSESVSAQEFTYAVALKSILRQDPQVVMVGEISDAETAALGTPVVVPFGSTSPELTGPGLPGDARHLRSKSDAPCSPCFLRECPIDFRCLNGISVERVVEAVLQCSGTL